MHRLALLGALALARSSAPTGEADALLRWQAPAECPSREQVALAIAGVLGRPLAPRDARALKVRASARRRGDGRWALALTIVPRDAPAVARTVVAEQCALLADAAALIVAVAIDPELAGAAPIAPVDAQPTEAAPSTVDAKPADAAASTAVGAEPAGAAPSTAEPTSRAPVDIPLAVVGVASRESTPHDRPAQIPARPPTSPRVPVSPQERQLRAALSAGVGLDVGALPRPAPGLLVRATLLARRWRVELGGVHWFAQPARLASTDAGGDIRLTAAQLAACPRFARRRLELPVCAGLELGAMRGTGVGLAAAASDRVVWLAVLADARLLWVPTPRVAVGLQVGLAAPLLAARFRVGGLAEDLHRAAPVTFRGGLAVELRFP